MCWNKKFTSQLEYIVFVGDSNVQGVPIISRSYKARRMTQFILIVELIAFSNKFHGSLTLQK